MNNNKFEKDQRVQIDPSFFTPDFNLEGLVELYLQHSSDNTVDDGNRELAADTFYELITQLRESEFDPKTVLEVNFINQNGLVCVRIEPSSGDKPQYLFIPPFALLAVPTEN